MILSDRLITEQVIDHEMIDPFRSALRRVDDRGNPSISHGISSYGYDLTLSPRELLVFRHRRPGEVIDPKNFKPNHLEALELLHTASDGAQFWILPAHSYALGVALERLRIPRNITGVCLGKSTYARCGIVVNTTPAEAGWEGHLTLEIANCSPADVRIYAGEGICQMLFFEGQPCTTSYADRAGKYQGQAEQVTLATV